MGTRGTSARWRLGAGLTALALLVSGVWAAPASAATGCGAANGTDVAIADGATVESAITISGCATASTASTVAVHVIHP
jgi:hypothetical protein